MRSDAGWGRGEKWARLTQHRTNGLVGMPRDVPAADAFPRLPGPWLFEWLVCGKARAALAACGTCSHGADGSTPPRLRSGRFSDFEQRSSCSQGGIADLSPTLSFREEEEDKMLEAMIKRKGKKLAGGFWSAGFAADLSEGQRKPFVKLRAGGGSDTVLCRQ